MSRLCVNHLFVYVLLLKFAFGLQNVIRADYGENSRQRVNFSVKFIIFLCFIILDLFTNFYEFKINTGSFVHFLIKY
jgi:hypothetical protein